MLETSQGASRFVDLFCGAGSVSWFAAANCNLPVLSVDLQQYATTLATAVTGRDSATDTAQLEKEWLAVAEDAAIKNPQWKAAVALVGRQGTQAGVADARRLCEENGGGLVWRAYGGYYFSPRQAIMFDALIESLPVDEPERTLCLAATITSAVECVASPGHTAQPFRPTANGIRFIDRCWSENPIERSRRALSSLGSRHAKKVGAGLVGDANDVIASLMEQDVVFIDPPYSAEQYSRFYHVLETIARGKTVEVSGAGRYPDAGTRPRSGFSLKSR
ncbi:MAG: DNA adenine methylase, partial [Coriobacteriia bacterium]|nr:DNA adenine methylase [Coriobacteriia bacterium]